jgi:hypothetical protein
MQMLFPYPMYYFEITQLEFCFPKPKPKHIDVRSRL